MRKITKFKRSVKGISPVISVLLMIAIAVVASLVAYAWVMGFIGGKTSKAGNAIQIQEQTFTQSGNLTLYVQNTGQGLVHLKQDGSVYVNDVLHLITQSPVGTNLASGQLIPIAQGQTAALVIDAQYHSGDKIKVVTIEGTFMQTTGTGNSGNSGGSGNSPQSYQVSFVLGAGGSSMTPPVGAYGYSSGSVVPLTATAATGYQFSSWTSSGSITFDSATSSSTTATIGGAGSITANFVQIQSGQNYQVNFVLGTGGSTINPTAGTHTYSGTTPVAISTTALTGYVFSSWTSTGTISFDSATSSSTNAHIGSAGTITANFDQVQTGQNYQVNFVLGTGGTSMNPAGTQTYTSGATVAISAVAASGYQFSSWTTPDTISFDSAISSSTNAHIGSTGTITANFVATNSGQSYQVVFNLGFGGVSMSPTGTQTYPGSSVVPLTAVVATGYQFSSWTNTGTITFDSTSSASTNAHIGSSGSITANFIQTQTGTNYNVNFVLGTGGSTISPTAGSHSEPSGIPVAISTTATTGYLFSSWTASTGSITFDSSVSASTNAYISAAGTITANFVAISSGKNYQVNFVLGTGGSSMSPTGTQTYAGGASVPLSAVAATGYQFSSWTSSGTISFDAASSASTNAHIGSAGTITANFVQSLPSQNYQVTFVMGAGGASMTPAAGTQSYAAGASVPLTATAATGYQFLDWTISGSIQIGNVAQASTSATINGAGTITANFAASGTIISDTSFDTNPWDQNWQAGSNPPWFAAPGEGIGGTTAAKSNAQGDNSGPFTSNQLDTSKGTLIHITFMYKVHQLDSASDLKIAYSNKSNPNLNPGSSDFVYAGNLGLPGASDQWYQCSFTIAKTAAAGSANITDVNAFTTHFWWRFESTLTTLAGGDQQQVWVDNVLITET
jgi:flagellin-like protein